MTDINGRIGTLWDFHSLNRSGRLLTGHTSGIWISSFSKDDDWLVTASADGTARLWFLKEGADRAWSVELRGHSGTVDHVRLLDDNIGVLTSSSADGTARIWPLRSEALREAAQRVAGRNLAWSEWILAFPGAAYRTVFAKFPVSDDTLAAALREAERQDGAKHWADYALVARLALDSMDANILNRVCWELTLRGQASLALPVCDRGVIQFPKDFNLLDSRGVARGISGNVAGAVNDLEQSLLGADYSADERVARQSWIRDLKSGINPFASRDWRRGEED